MSITANLSEHATEQSTYVISASFQDESGDAVVPSVITWTLVNDAGAIINDRLMVSVSPLSTIDVVLSGDDLELVDNTAQARTVIIEATYDSSLGNGLPLKDGARFEIDPLPYVA